MIKSMPLNEFLSEYTERNIDNKYRPVAVGRYGIRSRDSIYSKELAKDYSKNKLIFKNTLTIGMGSVQIDIGILSTDETYSVSPAYHTYRINNINPNYLRYCLECRNQDMFVRYVKKGSRQGKTIDLSRWLAYEIPVYSIEDQEKIVDKIDRVQGIIDASEKQLVKLDELVKSRFVEMFGEPVSNTFGWEQLLLCNVTSKIGSGATPKGGKESYQAEGITLIRSMNVHDGRFEYKDLAHITDEQATQLNNVTVQENDVFINITGASVARSCIVPSNVLPARVNQHVAIIRCVPDRLNAVFANNMFLNDRFKGQLLDIGESGGATRQAITKQQLENLTVIVPPLELQNRFAAFVAEVDKSKLAVKQSLEKLETLKKSLMQQYFG